MRKLTTVAIIAGLLWVVQAAPAGAQNIEWKFAGDYPGADIGAKVMAAVADLPPSGGLVRLPCGLHDFTTPIVLTTNITLEGCGNGYFGRFGTRLLWTGAGGTLIRLTGGHVTAHIRNFSIDNIGSAEVAIDIDDDAVSSTVESITVRPQIGFSVACVRIGYAGSVVDITLRDVYCRNNRIGLLALHVNGHLVIDHSRFKQNLEHEAVFGTDSTFVYSLHSFGSLYEARRDHTAVVLNRVAGGTFVGDYFEHGGNGYALEIPSTAHSANGISISDSYFASDGDSTAAIRVNNPAAFLSVTSSRFDGYVTRAVAVQNDAAARVLFIGNDLPFSGARETSNIAGVTSFSNSAANVPNPDARFPDNIVAGRQLQSNAPRGVAPLVVTSDARVANLNADLLDGRDWGSPGGIGVAAPALGSFTALEASSLRVGGGTQIRQHLSSVTTLDFGAWTGVGCQIRAIAFANAADGDSIVLGVPGALAQIADVQYTAFVAGPGAVTIRACKATTGGTADPRPAALRVDLWKH